MLSFAHLTPAYYFCRDSGLIQAYRAWKAQYDTSYEAGNEYLLPGLPYSRFVLCSILYVYSYASHRDQLFFISFARIWAKNTKAAALVSVAIVSIIEAHQSNCNATDSASPD